MKRSLLPLVVVLAVAVAAGAAWLVLSRGFDGSGSKVTTERRTLPPFARIVIEGQPDVTLVQGAAEGLVVEVPSRHQARVRAEVRDGTLVVTASDSRRWWSRLFGGGTRAPRITVTFRDLDALQVAGAVKIRADGLKADRLAITATGAASLKLAGLDVGELSVEGAGAIKAELAGRAVVQKVAISGAGSYRAADLASDRAAIAVSGAGRVVVHAEKTLSVALSGAGVVEYLGDPEVKQEISGAGRVRKRDAAEAGAPSVA